MYKYGRSLYVCVLASNNDDDDNENDVAPCRPFVVDFIWHHAGNGRKTICIVHTDRVGGCTVAKKALPLPSERAPTLNCRHNNTNTCIFAITIDTLATILLLLQFITANLKKKNKQKCGCRVRGQKLFLRERVSFY